jgi:carboxylesterase
MRSVGESLAGAGLRARALLLPGHGTHPDDLEGVVWQDWYERLHDEYCDLAKDHDEVSLVGFSIGAALCAHYAAHNRVRRLVLLNVPLCPLNGRFPTGLMLRMYGTFFKVVKGSPEIIIDEDGEPFSYVYERVPTAILHTMSELIGIVRKGLFRIECPVLIIQSSKDKVSGGKSGPLAYRRVCSSEKRLVMLEDGDHSIMMGVDRERVHREVVGFLNGGVSKQ